MELELPARVDGGVDLLWIGHQRERTVGVRMGEAGVERELAVRAARSTEGPIGGSLVPVADFDGGVDGKVALGVVQGRAVGQLDAAELQRGCVRRRQRGRARPDECTAKDIITTCVKLRIPIPDDIALVSVDNDIELCEHLPVTLTSIELDHAEAVRKSVAFLDGLMNGTRRSHESCTFGVKRIVRRASANGFRNIDYRVARAMEYIRVHACEDIGLGDVVREMGCSERLATLRFAEVVRHTILDEIHLRRIDVAKEKLAVGAISIDTISGLCGYASPTDFGRVFKRYTDLTPREWRKRSR